MVKLSVAKYWFSMGHLDQYDGKEYAPLVTIPRDCEQFYNRGYFTGKHRWQAAINCLKA